MTPAKPSLADAAILARRHGSPAAWYLAHWGEDDVATASWQAAIDREHAEAAAAAERDAQIARAATAVGASLGAPPTPVPGDVAGLPEVAPTPPAASIASATPGPERHASPPSRPAAVLSPGALALGTSRALRLPVTASADPERHAPGAPAKVIPISRAAAAPAFTAADVRRFLEWLGAEPVLLVAFHPEKGPVAGRAFHLPDQIDAAIEWARRMNEPGRNVYWHVNRIRDGFTGWKAGKSDVTAARFAVADVDPDVGGGTGYDAARARLVETVPPRARELGASAIIDSGNGVQLLFRLAEPVAVDRAGDEVEDFSRGLAAAFSGDAVQNLDRVLRLPGTVNFANKGKREKKGYPTQSQSRVMYLDGPTWRIGDGLARFPAPPREPAPAAATSAGPEPHRLPEVQSALGAISPDVDRDTWLRILMAMKAGLGDAGLPLAISWSRGDLHGRRAAKFEEGDVETRWASFRRSGVGLGTLFALAREAGWTGLSAAEEFRDASPADDYSDLLGEPPPGTPRAAAGAAPASAELLATLGVTYQRGQKGVIKADGTAANVERALAHLYGERLELDDRAGSIIFDGHRLVEGSERNRVAADVARFLGWHEDPHLATLRAGLAGAAGRNAFDPVVRALDDLPPWDGTMRFAELARALGVRGTDEDRKRSADMLVKFAIGAVRRAREPGAKVDSVPVLIGGQGLGKTEALRTLAQVAPDDGAAPLFARVTAKLKDKDARIALQGPWLVELAELAAVRRADNETVKEFLDEREDWYRPPYGETFVRRKRRVAVAGTTNDDEFLNDPTGARRYWPIPVEDEVDLGWIRQNRGALWAEADARAAAGEPHWYERTPDWLRERHEDAHEEGLLEEEVEAIVERYEAEWRAAGSFRTADVLLHLSDDAKRGCARPDMAIGAKLRRLGFRKGQRRDYREGTNRKTLKKAWYHPKWARGTPPTPPADDAE